MEGEKCQRDQDCIGCEEFIIIEDNYNCQRCSRPIYRKIHYGHYTHHYRAVIKTTPGSLIFGKNV